MDFSDFDRPHGFHVRYYNNNLQYKVHNVLPYKTSSPNHIVYQVLRSRDKVNVWLTNDEIVAQLDNAGRGNYNHFPLNSSAIEIVCAMLSKTGRLVVADCDSIQPGLF